MICTRYLLICTEILMIHWTWRVQLHEKIKQINNSDSDVFYLHQIPISSLWIWTQWINISVCLRETEWLLTLAQSSCILIIQTDLMVCVRCCVERVSVDAVTGSWSGWIGNGVSISVSYKSISRKGRGKECWFGSNDQSWSLFCSSSRY